VIVVGKPQVAVKLKKLYLSVAPMTYTIGGIRDTMHHVYAYNVKPIPAAKAKNLVYITERANDEITIDTNPLIIIDGKEAKTFKNIAPLDINSITVLKDGSATRLYGDKGKNGVIVIKTKKGRSF
jgi:TonB-dependent SusC/RagA subfamily outer membrane receptor